MAEDFTLGVEEEFLIVDAETRRLRPEVEPMLARAQEQVGDEVRSELQRSQLESGTAVCETLGDLRAELVRLRRGLTAVAEESGCRIAAVGTHPFSSWQEVQVTPKAAYVRLEQDYQQLAREQLVCGCHVHVGISDREAAVQVLNRIRAHLPTILALSVNSPFWQGVDTGYGSFRTELWRRWPTNGVPEIFESAAEYDQLVDTLLSTGSVDDPGRIYFDARLSHRFDTVEIRVSDACLTVNEAVMVAGLQRALARTSHTEAVEGRAMPRPRPELLRAALWRAARYGVEADLVDVVEGKAVPARELVDGLLDHLRPALEEAGDWDEVASLVAGVMEVGTGARRQRDCLAQRGRLEDVVDFVLDETAAV